MAKKPIYLDDRERDLTRRICDYALGDCKAALNTMQVSHICVPAIKWLRDEVDALRAKFEEESR